MFDVGSIGEMHSVLVGKVELTLSIDRQEGIMRPLYNAVANAILTGKRRTYLGRGRPRGAS